MKFAAIDVGSNAVRLLVSRIDESGENPLVKKEAMFRVPLRLGVDVFLRGRLSDDTSHKLVETMKAFRSLLEVFKPRDFLACATSAMRDSENSAEVTAAIDSQTGIQLEIIDGLREADIIFSSHVERQLDPAQSYLFIDVGGGSTELMLYHQGVIRSSASFNIGSVRMLNDAVPAGEWERMKQWVLANVQPFAPLGIGSGGNIARLNRMARQDETKPLGIKRLKQIHRQLKGMTDEERIRAFQIRPDRSEVIVPAGEVYLSVMKWGQISKIHVPKFGLVDGLVRILYDRYRNDG